MKRMLNQILSLTCCWLAIGLLSKQLAGQELSISAPSGASQPYAESLRAYLGVTFEPEIRNAAVAQSVAPGSPAEQAGLRAGDVIETLNGQRVSTYQDVLDAVRWMKPGDSIDIVASRRVSIRTQAVLEHVPDGYRRTVDLATPPDYIENDAIQPTAAEELLPAPPSFFRERPTQGSVRLNTDSIPPRRYTTNQELRRPDDNRASQRNDGRDSRNRGLFFRRRLGRQ
jgi:membrane-associated protease RseP (regulator of RpoE activity)